MIDNENWHSEFNPSKFLSRVNLEQLIERNEAYNESNVDDAKSPCIFCGTTSSRGILLNDRSFLCERCYLEVSYISFPEKYEILRRHYIQAKEARRLAFESFREKFEHKSKKSIFFVLGVMSVFLAFFNVNLIIISGFLTFIGICQNSIDKDKTNEWLNRKAQWEQSNPNPQEPVLKHFHDPTAELTQRDLKILRIFNHWPGYPPFWKYLRSVVIERDSNRCQVTGCPSRLGLQVHHMLPVANGGTHSPDNLVTLCDFHHALEPERGHERIWGEIKNQYFTLVCKHERRNRATYGKHLVQAHLRRLQLVTLIELCELRSLFGFCCPSCGESKIKFTVDKKNNTVTVKCPTCEKSMEGPQQLPEETGPHLAEVLSVTRNMGRWMARWDMLSERKNTTWGKWGKDTVPSCPKCGSPMQLIMPRPQDGWTAFWGCPQYSTTGCRGSRKYTSTKY